MRVLYIGGSYKGVSDCFSEKIQSDKNNPETYDDLFGLYETQHYNYFEHGYCDEFIKLGNSASYIISDEPVLLNAWAREHISTQKELSLNEIALHQIIDYAPDLIMFCNVDAELVRMIKEQCASVKRIIGVVGSAVLDSPIWEMFDAIISCAPETVEKIKKDGFKAFHVNHAFYAPIAENVDGIQGSADDGNIVFSGHVIKGNEFHDMRAHILEELIDNVNLKIYSPEYIIGNGEILKNTTMKVLYDISHSFQKTVLGRQINKLPGLNKAVKWKDRPESPVSRKLRKTMCAPVFGMDMFNTIAGASGTLNIHADSSPVFASNMRLFETTGVGGCLITDYKSNIADLFEPDSEIIVYKDEKECIEKCKWVLNHPEKALEIAIAGQKRCLKEHTYSNRMEDLKKALELII